jgi:hypothetical protein
MVIPRNITIFPKLWIRRWYDHTGKITDIINDGRQFKKILNLIFEKLFEPADTLIEEWIFGSGCP